MTPADLDTLLRQAITGDATAAARIAEFATTTRDRQIVAVFAAHAAGDLDQVDALARDHLADYPDSPLVTWIAAAGRAVPNPPTVLASPDHEKEPS